MFPRSHRADRLLARRARFPQGVEEDHRFEQFFYDEATTDRIIRSASKYERPLFLCNPSRGARGEGGHGLSLSIAIRDGATFFRSVDSDVLNSLSRDRRGSTTTRCSATPPSRTSRSPIYEESSILAATPDQAAAPLWLAYPGDREEAVLEAFDGYTLERKPPALGYRSVKEKTQQRIFLYADRSSRRRDARTSLSPVTLVGGHDACPSSCEVSFDSIQRRVVCRRVFSSLRASVRVPSDARPFTSPPTRASVRLELASVSVPGRRAPSAGAGGGALRSPRRRVYPSCPRRACLRVLARWIVSRCPRRGERRSRLDLVVACF